MKSSMEKQQESGFQTGSDDSSRQSVPQGRGPSVSRWANEIRDLWARSRSDNLRDIFKLARSFCDFRRQLPHGEWTLLWQTGQNMPFSRRKAEMLIRIGEGMKGIRAQSFARLPTRWSVLYYLAQLEPFQLEALIEEGTVHPELTLREARELVAEYNKGQPVSKDPKDSDFRKKVERLCKCVSANMENAEEEYAWARGKLLSLAEQMEVAAGVRFVPTNIQGDLGPGDFE